MATLTLKQVPDELYQRLKDRATAHRRSLNNEAIFCLEQVLQPQPLDVDDWLTKARTLRRRAAKVYLTDEALLQAKEDSRL